MSSSKIHCCYIIISAELKEKHILEPFSSVQSLSRVRLFATSWIAAHQASLSITISRSSLKLTFITHQPCILRQTTYPFTASISLFTEWYGMEWHAQSCPTLCDPMDCSPPGSSESVMPSSHLILCLPLLPLPSIPPSIRVFSNESTLRMRWPKYWSVIPSKEIPGLISFRMDWLDLLAVQGTLKSLLQHHSSKESILGS